MPSLPNPIISRFMSSKSVLSALISFDFHIKIPNSSLLSDFCPTSLSRLVHSNLKSILPSPLTCYLLFGLRDVITITIYSVVKVETWVHTFLLSISSTYSATWLLLLVVSAKVFHLCSPIALQLPDLRNSRSIFWNPAIAYHIYFI